jgi:predicted metal-binding membrane protein
MTQGLAMIYNARDLAPVRNSILLVSAVTWILLLNPGGMLMIAHCPATGSVAMPFLTSAQMWLTMNPLLNLAAGWALMLVAMMSPVLIEPIRHIRLRSFTRRRARSIMLFVTGYTAIWIALGSVLLPIELAIKLFQPQSYLPATGVILVTVVWQCSPTKQLCLNRCHAHSELAAFGPAADLDALRFGLTHGIWCAGSCWGLMLIPMLVPSGHLVAMATVAILIFGERLEQPGPPCWRWRGLGKATRIVIAQTRIHLDTRRSASRPSASSN